MFLFGNGFVALAEQRVSSGLAAVACAAMPLFACGFSLFFGERPSRREWVGVALGVAGVVLLALGDLRKAPMDGVLLPRGLVPLRCARHKPGGERIIERRPPMKVWDHKK